MYLIRYNDSIDGTVLKNLNEGLEALSSVKTLRIIDITFNEETILDKLKNSNIAVISVSAIKDIDYDDLVLDLIESGVKVYLNFDTDVEDDTNDLTTYKNFIEVCSQYGLFCEGYKENELIVPPSIDYLKSSDIKIVHELLLGIIADDKYELGEHPIRYRIEDDGTVLDSNDNERFILSSSESVFYFLQTSKEDIDRIVEQLKDSKVQTVEAVTNYFYSDVIYLMFNITTKDIIDYKYKIFDLIKDINPEQYNEIPDGLVVLLNRIKYICLTDLKKILNIV